MTFHGHYVSGIQVIDLIATPNLMVSEHFSASEFQCRPDPDAPETWCPVVLIHPATVQLLERIRSDAGGHPVHINSGFRTHEHNLAVDGKPYSRHLFGFAADIRIDDVPPSRVADIADRMGAGGVGRYRTFTHVDVWGEGRRWNG